MLLANVAIHGADKSIVEVLYIWFLYRFSDFNTRMAQSLAYRFNRRPRFQSHNRTAMPQVMNPDVT